MWKLLSVASNLAICCPCLRTGQFQLPSTSVVVDPNRRDQNWGAWHLWATSPLVGVVLGKHPATAPAVLADVLLGFEGCTPRMFLEDFLHLFDFVLEQQKSKSNFYFCLAIISMVLVFVGDLDEKHQFSVVVLFVT